MAGWLSVAGSAGVTSLSGLVADVHDGVHLGEEEPIRSVEPTRNTQHSRHWDGSAIGVRWVHRLSLLALCAACRVLSARMNFLGLFTFTAPYLPWVLLAFSFVLGNNGVVDVVGIGVGHVYYFLEDVYPLMLPSRKRLLATPRLVQLLFNQQTDEQLNAAEQLPHIIQHDEHIHQDMQMQDDGAELQRQQQQERRAEEAPAAEVEADGSLAEQNYSARLAEADVERHREVQDSDSDVHDLQDAADDGIADSDPTGLHRRSTRSEAT